jgi:hypothetical protein
VTTASARPGAKGQAGEPLDPQLDAWGWGEVILSAAWGGGDPVCLME